MFKNILLSNIDIDASCQEYRKLIITNLGYLIAITAFASFSIGNFFIQKNFTAGVFEFIFIFPMLYGFIKLRMDKDINSNALYANYMLFISILTVLFLFKFNQGIVFWAFLFPFIATNLSGIKKGLRFMIVFNIIAYIGAYYFWQDRGILTIEYIRFVTVSLIISTLVYFYERSISNSFKVQSMLNESLKGSYKEVRMLAITDALTTLYNKRHFDEILTEEFNRAKRAKEPFILAILDVDNFKSYNDTYGHDAGNEALMRVGMILRSQTSRSGDFAFRIGGEEFAIILQSSSSENIHTHFDNLRKLIEDEKIEHINNQPFALLTISIGIVYITNYRDITIIDAYKRADQNLYAVKKSGRNNIKLTVI